MIERLINVEKDGKMWVTDNDFTRENGIVVAIMKKLREYETAEEEGRLVVLPCKVGDTVWMIHQELTDSIHFTILKMSIVELRGNRLNPIWFVIDGEYGKTSFSPSRIGKTIFLALEEAEKVLEEMKKNE